MTDVAAAIRAELVCCDIFERIEVLRVDDDVAFRAQLYRGHDVCYWGEAAARIAESRGGCG